MIEEWKPIKDYEDVYEISNLGRLKSKYHKNEKILKYGIDHTGYYQVCLSRNNKPDVRKVHKLVITHFLGERPKGMVINHIDHNKFNNKITNLEYCTQKHNIEEAVKAGRYLTKKILQYDLKGNFIKEWNSSAQIKEELGIPRSSVLKVCSNDEKYKHCKTAHNYIWKFEFNIGSDNNDNTND